MNSYYLRRFLTGPYGDTPFFLMSESSRDMKNDINTSARFRKSWYYHQIFDSVGSCAAPGGLTEFNRSDI